MLLNLSNHSFKNWLPEQQEMALREWGRVEDLPFPPIPPESESNQIELLAQEYLEKIREIKPEAVHLMGEMTFTCTLVCSLQRAGIPCLASTTRRKAIEEGNKKISIFEFVRFRYYPVICS